MKVILIVISIVANGWGGGNTTSTTLEFNSMNECQIAAKQIKEDTRKHIFPSVSVSTSCVLR